MWRTININNQNIIKCSGKAVLIACPHNSRLNGFEFWHPSKLIKNGESKNQVSISYTDDFIFKLKKFGKGKYNKFKIVEEKDATSAEIEDAFECMNHEPTNICDED